MKLNQLSVFLEGEPGRLSRPCKALAAAGVNIVALSLADTHQFGILRLIVRDWEKARAALEDARCVVNVTEVIAVKVPDCPGGLADVLAIVEKADISVEYMYALASRDEDGTIIIFRFDDPDSAAAAVQAEGLTVIDSVDRYDRA